MTPRSVVWMSAGLAALTGGAAVYLIAPVAVAFDLAAAYAALATSPNLAASIGYGAWWLVAVAATAAVVAWAVPSIGRASVLAATLLVVGIAWTTTVVPAAAMSNAIADAGSDGASTAELPAWLLPRIGIGAILVGAGILAVGRTRRRSEHAS